ncbi:hypothetical protein B0H13DRAFT_2012212 [Mycena leptocephala]|nr:hypothetical protein B0H13DRAFT_2012212 [Mycena leptocephala]
MIPRCPARTVQFYCFLCECAEKSIPLQSCCLEGTRCPPYTQEKQQKKRTELERSAGLGLHWSRKRWVYTQAGAGSLLKPNATKSRAEKTREDRLRRRVFLIQLLLGYPGRWRAVLHIAESISISEQDSGRRPNPLPIYNIKNTRTTMNDVPVKKNMSCGPEPESFCRVIFACRLYVSLYVTNDTQPIRRVARNAIHTYLFRAAATPGDRT